MTCGELLTRLLDKYDVEVIFGIPGVHTVELYRGLPKTCIKHVTPRHEQGAGFMADGYARCTGKPGVCFIVTGPGMTNIATAIAQAAADSVPMLVISSVNSLADIGSQEGHLHELGDQRGVVHSLCAFSKTVWQPRDLPKMLAEAFDVFCGFRPRPVHIQIPVDVIAKDAGDVDPRIGACTEPPTPAAGLLDQAADILSKANFPVICYGGGAKCAGQVMATRLSECLGAPTLLTVNAKGLLLPGHPLLLGRNHRSQPVWDLIREADALIAIGTEMGQTDYGNYFGDALSHVSCLIRIDIDPLQLNKPYLSQLAIAGDATGAIRGLLERLTPYEGNRGARAVGSVRNRLAKNLSNAAAGQCAILKLIRETLPGVTFVGDSTQPVYAGNTGFETVEPGSWFNSATGYGTLGYALPAAIGAKVMGHKPVVCIIGDGGLQFTLSEMMTAVENYVSVIILVWQNQGYGEIRNYMNERRLPAIGVNISAPNYRTVAKAFGAGYTYADSIETLTHALKENAEADGPSVLEVDENAKFVCEMAAEYTLFS
jgi:acetolactate synthase-1/2/3 large subunit